MIRRQAEGFTIVELMLAMAFVSVLLLAIAATVLQLSGIYNKGMTMKAVDQAGRTISDDIRRTLSESQPFATSDTNYKEMRLASTSVSAMPDGGRLCTGSFSYVWNTGQALSRDAPVNRYVAGSGSDLRFTRVRDIGGQYCRDTSKDIDGSEATELLSNGDRDLAVHTLKLDVLANDPGAAQALYLVTMTIGTNDQPRLDSVLACAPPSDDDSVQDFCSVNTFEFTVQAGNKGARL